MSYVLLEVSLEALFPSPRTHELAIVQDAPFKREMKVRGVAAEDDLLLRTNRPTTLKVYRQRVTSYSTPTHAHTGERSAATGYVCMVCCWPVL